jgi:hypothetical protein
MQDPPPRRREQPPSTPPAPAGGAAPAPEPPGQPGASAPPARWGQPGYQGRPDANRQSRFAVAWILGILGGLGLVLAALVGVSILYWMGNREPAPVVGAPFPTSAPPTAPSTPGQDPTTSTGTGAEPPPSSGDGAVGRTSNAFYSIRIPDGFQDVTSGYLGQHPADRDTVQVLAGQPGSPAAPDSTIVISQLPSGADRGRSLDRLAADQVRGLQRQGATGAGAPRHSSLGPDPAVEVDLRLRSGAQPLTRTQVLCVHDGRVWEIAVTGPAGSRTLLAEAWTAVKTGWQWR